MQPVNFCRRRLTAVMAALERTPSLALVQEGILLSSLLELGVDAAAFAQVLEKVARDTARPHLARRASHLQAVWAAQLGRRSSSRRPFLQPPLVRTLCIGAI